MNTDLFTFGFTQTRMPDEQVYMVALAMSIAVCMGWSICGWWCKLVVSVVGDIIKHQRQRSIDEREQAENGGAS